MRESDSLNNSGGEREGWLSRHSWMLVVAMIAVASLRIVSTYWVLSLTTDEPAHIACGMEWLEKGTYTLEAQHPPLARVMTAMLPYLMGFRLGGLNSFFKLGWAILNAGGDRDRTLAMARLGILPFFWLGSLVVFLWTRHYFGKATALLATMFFTMLPPILAHAGLATTDMALTATFGAAFYAMLVWIERPSPAISVGFGVALAAAVLSKYSTFAFMPASAAAALAMYIAVERPSRSFVFGQAKRRIGPLAIASLVAAVLIWAGFRFSFDSTPAPELFKGINEVWVHNQAGHLSYLLGQRSLFGFWYFYPVALGVKTPLALLFLFAVGAPLCWIRRRDGRRMSWIPLAFMLSIFAVGMYSRINIGIRHVLPVYFAICMIAAVGARWLWSSGKVANRCVVGVLMSWMVLSSVWSHPDYLAYFNEIAGKTPESILVDSDLDWGQDWKQLELRLKEAGATEVAVDPLLVANPEVLPGFPKLTPIDPDSPKPGWNVVSLSQLKLRTGLFHDDPRENPWPERIPPTERIGKGLLVWRIPPP